MSMAGAVFLRGWLGLEAGSLRTCTSVFLRLWLILETVDVDCALELVEPDRDSLPVLTAEVTDGLLDELTSEPGVEDLEDRREVTRVGVPALCFCRFIASS